MARNFVNVVVSGTNPTFQRTVLHGTGNDGTLNNVACGPFGATNQPTVGTRYQLTLPPAVGGGQALTISMYCTFSGDTSDFKLNYP